MKPTNILVCEDFSRGGAVLIDFGVAHSIAEDAHHRPTHIEASLPYTAPELLHGRAPSAAADEYALACTAVEMLTGSPPFNAITAIALIDDHLQQSGPPLLAPNRLDTTRIRLDPGQGDGQGPGSALSDLHRVHRADHQGAKGKLTPPQKLT